MSVIDTGAIAGRVGATGPRPAGGRPLRLHLSENPYGPSPEAARLVDATAAEANRYPDAEPRQHLVDYLADRWGVTSEQVAVGNGSDELVLLCGVRLGGERLAGVVTDKTFPGYAATLHATGRPIVTVPTRDGRAEPAALVSALPEAGIAFACNPHNPSGRRWDEHELASLVAAAHDAGTVLVVDEAYAEYADSPQRPFVSALHLAHAEQRIVVLRTLSKAYGLAGLRIGYAVGDAESIRSLVIAQAALPFRINRLGLAAARAALADTDHLRSVVTRNREIRDGFTARLVGGGVTVLPSATNFVTVAVPDAVGCAERLLNDCGVLVKELSGFGLDDHLRISLPATAAELTEATAVLVDHVATNTRERTS